MRLKRITFVIIAFFVSFSSIAAQMDTISAVSNPIDGGTITGIGEYPSGTDVTITAFPNVGYIFENWTENALEVSSDSNYAFISTGNRKLTANFSLKSYSISATVNPLTGGNISGNGTYLHGASVELVATSSEGYNFINWTADGIEVSTDSVYSFTADQNRDLVANFDLESYEIIVDIMPALSGNVTGDGQYLFGDTAELIAIPTEGYYFRNWTEDGIEVSADSVFLFTVDKNRTLSANFELYSYIVSTDVNLENSGNTTGDGTYPYGSEVTLSSSAMNGYTFINWTENGIEVSTDSVYLFNIYNDRNLIANYSLNNYLIITSASPLSGGVVSGGGSFDAGELVQLTAVPADGYIFSHWSENDTVVYNDSAYSFIASRSRNITAVFSINQYEVITNAIPAEGGATIGDSMYNHGSLVRLRAVPNQGWKFENWSNESNTLSVDSSYSFVVFEDQLLYANFSKKTFSVAVASIPVDGGMIKGSGNYHYDSVVTMTATPNVGWNFLYWKEGDKIVSSDSILTFNARRNVALEAHFAQNVYQITTNCYPQEGGICVGDSIYTHGDVVNLAAYPDSSSGYDFVMWTENEAPVSTDSVYTFIAEKGRSLIAVFQLRSYIVNLQASPSEGGILEGEGRFVHGDSITVKANPAEGWLFANWTDGEVNISSDPKYKFAIKENKNITANFANELYTIVCTSDPVDAGIIVGSGSFYYGQTAMLTPIPNVGWEFENWSRNGTVISTDTVLVFNVIENADIKANYRLKYFSINCSANPIEAGSTNGCGLSNYDQEMTVGAFPNNGWEFTNWSENGIVVSNSPNYAFNVKGDRDLVANFELITGIEQNESEVIPDNYYLSNAYPNPFNPSTKVNFGLPETSSVKILLYNINGQLVKNIISDLTLPAGNYNSSINAENLSSGMYLYVFLAQSQNSGEKFKKIEKLVLLK